MLTDKNIIVLPSAHWWQVIRKVQEHMSSFECMNSNESLMGLSYAAVSLYLINIFHILQNKWCCYYKQVHLLDSETDDMTNFSNF